MKRALIDDSLWFVHKDGGRFYPWIRHSKHHGRSGFWVSDGSNLIEDAIPVATIADLLVEVFSRGRSVWLFDNAERTGLYRFRHDALPAHYYAQPSPHFCTLFQVNRIYFEKEVGDLKESALLF